MCQANRPLVIQQTPFPVTLSWRFIEHLSYCGASVGLRGKLPSHIALPPSVTVPFGAFEEALKQGANKDVARRLESALRDIPSTKMEEKLAEIRGIVMEVGRPSLCSNPSSPLGAVT